MTTVQQIITAQGDGLWLCPPGVTQVKLEGIGGGGSGRNSASITISNLSNGGGAYARTNAATVTPGTTYNFHVAKAVPGSTTQFYQDGDATWFGNGNTASAACLMLAAGGRIYDEGTNDAFSKGDVIFAGGIGALGVTDHYPGTSGGGAAGPNGAGQNGNSSNGIGGYADGNVAGAGQGGVQQEPGPPTNGTNGTEIWTDAAGTKYGAGGGGGGTAHGVGRKGGSGGLYGGGGGSGDALGDGGVAGDGAQGILVITYTAGPAPTYTYQTPVSIGRTYTSQGQILRAVVPAESGTQAPSLGKLRRVSYAAPLFYATQGVSIGVDFLRMRECNFKSSGGTVALTSLQLFSGVYGFAGQVDANHNYDNMFCWQVTRPYPCTMVAVECQLETKENN